MSIKRLGALVASDLDDGHPVIEASLTEPQWRTARRPSASGAATDSRYWFVAHAVRGGHTLCGLTVGSVAWIPAASSAPRCATCNQVPPGFATSADVVRHGITYRQLDNWVRLGWLRPVEPEPGSGHRRLFPEREWQRAGVMARLVNAGLPPRTAFYAVGHDGILAPGVRVVLEDAG